MVYTYMRQAPSFESLSLQRNAINIFVQAKKISIEHEVVEYATENLRIEERTEFETFLQTMKNGNTVIISSLSILSTNVDELIKVINCMLRHHVDLWIVDTNLCFNDQSKMVDIFPLLERIRSKKKGKVKSTRMGRPIGSKSSSKFDVYHSKIIAFLSDGKSVSAIARTLDVSRSSLKDYILSRGIKELVKGAGRHVREADYKQAMDNIILICPFEEAKENYKKAV